MPETGSPLIQIDRIVKTFRTAAGAVTVLKEITFSVQAGEFVGIVGRSGSGKSTLLNMLTGIDHPTSGTVTIGGTRLHELNESRLASWRGRSMGIVFQFFQLLPMLTLVENVMLPMDFCEIYAPAEREERAMQLLARVGLRGWEHKLPAAVSGGQQQSAAVARALATDPPILVADEPTGNLDSHTAEQVMQLFHELVEQGKTVLMVTHDSTLAQQTQRSLILADGELIHPALAAAFSKASHDMLLKLQHLSQPLTLPAGSGVDSSAGLLVVVSGSLVARSAPGRPAAAPVRFTAGQLAYLPGLSQAGYTLSAGTEQPAECLRLDAAAAQALLQGGQPRRTA